MNASVIGNPWYPLQCIVVLSCGGVVAAYAGHRAVFEVRRNIVLSSYFFGVSGDVGCLHISVGLKIESPFG